ncbi:RsmB/NOP family class I SAM-dependent RNA methyltransferase [Paenibacillus massiliensis]|uniref:RsmB/NOP family class I SAM-dependent RNA methyltransferase n=1 Tax=Paenibacillus massiliensis TaxID=225917 RepID=UPI0004706E6E|nr:RsmB/NOP family class I SAM-dependent RNA methyltransferase [Paenibacillus massiliensis]
MGVQLPSTFIERMHQLLGKEFDDFMSTYDHTPHAGLRVNELKISLDEFKKLAPFELRPIPWCETGFYVPHGIKPGLHPYYHTGLYYIQEPSAMAPVELLGVQEHDRVLDLCAAPGGKSTQIAAKLRGTGVLVTNDIHADRTKALAKNIELYGVRNAVVLNEQPERIAAAFPAFFDKILIDAPCSGEGMYRKDEDMVKSTVTIADCVIMQRDILHWAANMLAPGGTMVYSTCTFAPEENEMMIAEFLNTHPDYSIVEIPLRHGFTSGRPDWIPARDQSAGDALAGTVRLWPHRLEGEGHYAAVLRRNGGAEASPETPGTMEASSVLDLSDRAGLEAESGISGMPDSAIDSKSRSTGHLSIAAQSARGSEDSMPVRKGKGGPARHGTRAELERGQSRHGRSRGTASSKQRSGSGTGQRSGQRSGREREQASLTSYDEFVQEQLHVTLQGETIMYGDRIYQSPLSSARLEGLKVVRPGWYMGKLKNGRFVPSQPLAAALHSQEAIRVITLDSRQPEAVRYLKGETLEIPADRITYPHGNERGSKGYTLICIDGYAVGWGKWQNGMLKNEYPSGWRWTSV